MSRRERHQNKGRFANKQSNMSRNAPSPANPDREKQREAIQAAFRELQNLGGFSKVMASNAASMASSASSTTKNGKLLSKQTDGQAALPPLHPCASQYRGRFLTHRMPFPPMT